MKEKKRSKNRHPWLTPEILDDFKENSLFNGGVNLELVRDWETPLTKFYEGHYNTPHNLAKLLNLSLKDDDFF